MNRMKTAPSKIAERQHYGEEPAWNSERDRDLFYCRCLNWYHHMSDSDDHAKWLLDYMRANDYESETIKEVTATKRGVLHWGDFPSDELGINLGVHARILTNGGWVPDKTKQKFLRGIDRLAEIGRSLKEVKAEKDSAEHHIIGVQERIAAQVRDMIGELESVEDCITQGRAPVYPCACTGADAPVREGETCPNCGGSKKIEVNGLDEWMTRRGCKSVHASRIAELFRRRLVEIESVLGGKADEQLKEGYSVFSKKTLKAHREWLNELISKCEHTKAVSKKLRAPRRKRKKAPVEIVKNLKFKASDDEFKVKSILPSKIVGAEKLVTFNTKTRVVTIFEAESRDGLSVKGTTIIGFDEKKSVCKKMRKPQEIIGVVSKGGGIRAVKNAYNASKTVEKAPTGRINEDTILLGVY